MAENPALKSREKDVRVGLCGVSKGFVSESSLDR